MRSFFFQFPLIKLPTKTCDLFGILWMFLLFKKEIPVTAVQVLNKLRRHNKTKAPLNFKQFFTDIILIWERHNFKWTFTAFCTKFVIDVKVTVVSLENCRVMNKDNGYGCMFVCVCGRVGTPSAYCTSDSFHL